MATSRTEKIERIQEEIKQLENQRKKLMQQQKEQERKARTRRLVERGAILESLLDGAETLTNEDIKVILSAALGSGDALDAIIPIRKRQNATATKEPKAKQGLDGGVPLKSATGKM